MSDRRQRLPIGAALIVLVAGIVAFDHERPLPLLAPIAITVLAGLAIFEYGAMNRDRIPARLRRVAVTCGTLTVCSPAGLRYLHAGQPVGTLLAVWLLSTLFLLVTAVIVPRWSTGVEEGDLPAIGTALLGVVAVCMPLALIMEVLFSYREGVLWTALVVLGCKLNDIGGYLVGSSLPEGRKHRFCPGISPNKSIEGALGGLLLGVAGMYAFQASLGGLAVRLEPLPFLAFALLLGCSAQLGDLFESLMKRSAGVKDSGALLPAFGGALDMVDSFIFAAPLALLFAGLWL